MVSSKLVAFVALGLALGCAGHDPDADFPDQRSLAMDDPIPPPAPQKLAPARPSGVLYRDDVDKTVDMGFGYFLQRVDVSAALDNGRFRGFRIVELRPEAYWRGVDLRPGDVVLSVNDMPIEHETQAWDAFRSLKTAHELRVKYLRAGRQHELVYRIVERKPKSTADAGT